MSVNEKMTAIADAIRDKTGGTDKLSLDGIAQAIPEVYEAGKKSEWSKFWDDFQQNGKLSDYSYAFNNGRFNDNNFKPKYDIKPDTGVYIFANSKITDLAAILERQDVTLDFRNTWNTQYAFFNSTVTNIPEVRIASANDTSYFFGGCKSLHTIEKLVLKSNGGSNLTGMFLNCTSLQNIIIEGVIGKAVSFSACPLSKQSIMGKSITTEEYEALSDTIKNNNVFSFDGVYYYGGIIKALSSTTTGLTITFKKSAVNEAFGVDVDDETTYPEGSEFYTLRHSKDNWTFSYV